MNRPGVPSTRGPGHPSGSQPVRLSESQTKRAMEDVFDAAWQDASAAGNHSIEAELASLIDIYGLPLTEQPEQLRLLLSRACPTEPQQIAMIVAALNAQIPQGLRAAEADEALPSVLRRSATHLQAHAGIAPGWASWAVRAWAHALALPTTGDWATATIPEGRAFGSEPDESSHFGDTDDGRPRGGRWPPPDDVASVFARQGSGMARAERQAATPSRPSTVPSPAAPPMQPSLPSPPSPSQVSAPSAPAPSTPAVPPVPIDDPWSRREPVPAPDDEIGAAVQPPGGPIFVEPLFTERDILRIAHTASGIGVAAGNAKPAASLAAGPQASAPMTGIAGTLPTADGSSTTSATTEKIVAPAWAPPRESARRSLAGPVTLAAIAVAIPIAAWFWLGGNRHSLVTTQGTSPTTTGAAANRTEPPAAPTVAGTSANMAPPPGAPAEPNQPPTPASPAVDGGRSAAVVEPTTGAPAGTTAAPSSATAPAAPGPDEAGRSGPVSGSGPAVPTPSSVAGSPSVAASSSTITAIDTPPAGTPGQGAPDASAATATPAGPRPVIARIDVPRVVEGDPFAITLRLAGSARDVVAVERRIVEAGGLWPRTGLGTQTVGWRRTGNSTLAVPFRAMDAPSSAAIEFSVVTREGVRSAPQTATIALTGAAGPAGYGSPAAAAANAAPCTPSTCGTVVEARELVSESDTGRLLGLRGRDEISVYQIMVRMDDRETRAFSAPYRLQVNSRVRLVDQRFVPMVAPAR